MAEELVDGLLGDLRADARTRGEPAPKVSRCTTHKVPVDPGAIDVPKHVTGPADQLDKLLWHTHGSLADAVRSRLRSHPDEAQRVVADLPYTTAQAAIATLQEDTWGLEGGDGDGGT